jgi:DNA-binding ferritin-like protein
MTIEELFGTLQQATVASWRKHLRTAKYAKHEALDEFYKELPEKVDALIEGYMGAHGKKITKFENILKSSNMNTLKYLQELKKVCKEGYDLLDENEELEGLLDDIVNLINSTLYKVKELSEGQVIDLKDYVLEALSDNETNEALNEAKKVSMDEYTVLDVVNAITAVAPDIKWYKELRHNTVDDVLEYYTIYYDLEKELDADEDDIRDFVADHEDELYNELNDL